MHVGAAASGLKSPKGEGCADAFVDRDLVFVSELETDIAVVDLVDIERGDLGAWGDESFVGGKAAQEFGYDHTGVAIGEEGGDDGGDAKGHFIGLLGILSSQM